MYKNSFGSSQGKVILPPGALSGVSGVGGMSNTKFKDEKRKALDIIKDYKSLELPDDKLDGLRENFDNWVEDNSYLDNYKNIDLVPGLGENVMVRLYRYQAPLSTSIMGEDGSTLMGYKILPFVKIIKASSNNLTPGDVLYTPENITRFITNQAWIEWKILKDQGEGTQIPEPPMLTGLLSDWRNSLVRLDPCGLSEDDEFTFILSQREFKTIYKKNKN